MFRPDSARAYSGLEDRADRLRREGEDEEVLVLLAGLPADAVAVPAPVQPQRDRGRVEDIRPGALAAARRDACEPQHVLEREPYARPEGDAVVLLGRVRRLPQTGRGLHQGTPPWEADEVQPAWEHIEKNETASYAAVYDLAGAYYDKTYDNLLVCCLETYQGAQTHQGETFELDFSVDGAAVKTMVVQPATIKLKAGDNPSRLTFKFNDKTGLISGSVVSAAAGKACQYKGVLVLGLGGIDCGCGEMPEEGLLPFAAGSYYYRDKLQVGTTSVSIKRGGGIDIDAQQ